MYRLAEIPTISEMSDFIEPEPLLIECQLDKFKMSTILGHNLKLHHLGQLIKTR